MVWNVGNVVLVIFMSNTATWMSDMSDILRNHKLREIVIPGTHNSGAYNLRNSVSITVGSCYANCQSKTIEQQLNEGIRYLDLRVMLWHVLASFWDDLFLVHTPNGSLLLTFWGKKVGAVLQTINTFLTTHPGEIVVLSFNHFYNMTPDYHRAFAQHLQNVLESIAVRPTMKDQTIGQWLDASKQVVILYGGDQFSSSGCNDDLYAQFPFLWRLSELEETWANTTKFKKLYDDSLSGINNHNTGIFYCLFGTFTMQLQLSSIFSSIEAIADRGNPRFQGWLQYVFARKKDRLNILCIDYYEKTDMVEIAIALNKGTLPNPLVGAALTYNVPFKLIGQNGKYFTRTEEAFNRVTMANEYYPRLNADAESYIFLRLLSGTNTSLIYDGDQVWIQTLESSVGEYNLLGAWNMSALYYYKEGCNNEKWIIKKADTSQDNVIHYRDAVYFVNVVYQEQWLVFSDDRQYLTTVKDGFFYWVFEEVIS